MLAPLSSLRNLGPKSQEMLQQAGICTADELRRFGAVAAFAAVRRTQANASLNLLWALEGALSDRAWQDVARQERLRLLLELETIEDKARHIEPGR